MPVASVGVFSCARRPCPANGALRECPGPQWATAQARQSLLPRALPLVRTPPPPPMAPPPPIPPMAPPPPPTLPRRLLLSWSQDGGHAAGSLAGGREEVEGALGPIWHLGYH